MAGGMLSDRSVNVVSDQACVLNTQSSPQLHGRQDGGIDDPTLDVTDPAWTEDEEDLALDLVRQPRQEAVASWVAAADGVDPFKVQES